jgi:SAM-dependent methyltransferase
VDAGARGGGSLLRGTLVPALSGSRHSGPVSTRLSARQELFALKGKLDPEYRFRNVVWDTYYAPSLSPRTSAATPAPPSDFHQVFDEVTWSDKFYLFLQNIFHLFPEDRLHALIGEACRLHASDEAIYRYLLRRLPSITPVAAPIRYALPALAKQKAEMSAQTRRLLGERTLDGYIEIGTTGRYVKALQTELNLAGSIVLVNDTAPSGSVVDVMERGGLRRTGRFLPLRDYAPLNAKDVPDSSVDLVTCYIGLHHADPGLLVDPFVRSIARVVRPGVVFVLRDHDVTSPAMNAFVSLAHVVFNAGLGLPWEANAKEPRHFAPAAQWVERIEAAGLKHTGQHLQQAHDPTDNVLMAFGRS